MKRKTEKQSKGWLTITILLGIMMIIPQMATATDYFSNAGVASPTYQTTNPQGDYFNNKTYTVYMGANYTPYVMMFDHISNDWSESVQIPGAWNSPPPGWNSNDNHFSQGILRDNDGYLHVYGGCHNCDLLYARSDYPDDISSWTFMPAINDAVTYPSGIVASNGDIYIFFRHYRDYGGPYWDRPMAYVKSTDGGDTWSAAQNIVDYTGTDNWVYQFPNPVLTTGTPEKIHLGWAYWDGGATSDDPAYAYLNLSDEHMYSINDLDLGVTVTKAESDEHCRIYAGPNGAQMLQIDNNEYPYVIDWTREDPATSIWQMISWNGTDWDYNTIMSRANDTSLYLQGSFVLHNESDIDAYMLVYSSIQHSHWDGISWSEPETILDQSNYHFGGLGLIHNHTDDIQLVFSEWAHTSSSADKKIYAYGNSGFVGSEGTDIKESLLSNPLNVILNQNFPNPFNPQTTISYSLSNPSDVSLSIYNIKGELIETLINEEQQAGDHSIVWDAEDVSSGIYLYQIKTEGSLETKKCVIMK